MSIAIEIWFDFASTYSYLTVARAEEILRCRGIEFLWRPFLLGPIFKAKGLNNSPFVLDQTKGRHMWRDVERRAEYYGVAFVRPPTFPMNGLRAARIMTAACEKPWCGAFARSVFEAQFARGEDIASEAVLTDVLERCGVDAAHWHNLAQSDLAKRRLRESTERARQLGIFGAPSFTVGSELFWGDDRLEDAIRWISRAPAGRRPTSEPGSV